MVQDSLQAQQAQNHAQEMLKTYNALMDATLRALLEPDAPTPVNKRSLIASAIASLFVPPQFGAEVLRRPFLRAQQQDAEKQALRQQALRGLESLLKIQEPLTRAALTETMQQPLTQARAVRELAQAEQSLAQAGKAEAEAESIAKSSQLEPLRIARYLAEQYAQIAGAEDATPEEAEAYRTWANSILKQLGLPELPEIKAMSPRQLLALARADSEAARTQLLQEQAQSERELRQAEQAIKALQALQVQEQINLTRARTDTERAQAQLVRKRMQEIDAAIAQGWARIRNDQARIALMAQELDLKRDVESRKTAANLLAGALQQGQDYEQLAAQLEREAGRTVVIDQIRGTTDYVYDPATRQAMREQARQLRELARRAKALSEGLRAKLGVVVEEYQDTHGRTQYRVLEVDE